MSVLHRVTGELREEFFNRAQEEKLNLYLCGHYATVRQDTRAVLGIVGR